MRVSKSFQISDSIIDRLTLFAGKTEFGFCFRGAGWGEKLNFNFDVFAGIGIKSRYEGSPHEASEWIGKQNDFIIAHLGYDLKNQLERLESRHEDIIGFSDLCLTVPFWLFILRNNFLEIQWNLEDFTESDADEIFNQICLSYSAKKEVKRRAKDSFTSIHRASYIDNLIQLKEHIQQGDIYQANLCQPFHWEKVQCQPAELFNEGFNRTPNPFSVFYKTGAANAICYSPERFLSIQDRHVISQPMKGTSARSIDPVEDQIQLETLRNSEKDRRENVMIVDMVRNDLSHFATVGSVQVPEIYRIDSYARVHQMLSTVSAQIKSQAHPFDALLKAFPMGSMTGAPKVNAMKIIDQLEWSRRGLFSGAIGFITPDLNMDFNVVIRTLMYNSEREILHCHAGGGITALSDPQAEFEECMLKVQPLIELVTDPD